ncbi:TrbC/VirB2 family protein [Candidatus Gracilibacteria bacterium]|nr:TrbC/VirB2 family protein [Candidatus Gracilibacteria bacterium]
MAPTLRERITQDYTAIASTSTKSTLSGSELQGAIAYAKSELSNDPKDPTLKSWLTIIAQRESDNSEIRFQLDELKDFLDAQGKRIIPAPVFDVSPTTVIKNGIPVPLIPSLRQINNQNGVAEVREALSEINPENLEKAITMSEKFINMIPFPETKNTLRGVHGAIIFQILRNAGHNLVMKNGQIEIIPKPGVDVVRLQEKLQTLIENKKISLDTIKMGMLYSSPSFQKYAEDKKTSDGIVSPNATSQDFLKYISDLKKSGDKTTDITTLLESQSMLQGVNMQQAIKGFQDMGQVNAEWLRQDPQKVANAIAGNVATAPAQAGAPSNPKRIVVLSSSTQDGSPPSSPPKPGTAGYYMHMAGTEAGSFGADAGKNVGTALGAVGNTLGGFVKGVNEGAGPLGAGIAVIGLIYAGYKLLTGEVKGHSGFFWSVVTLLGGSALVAGLKRFGIDMSDMTASEAVDKAKKATEKATEKAKKLAGGAGSADGDTEEAIKATKKEESKETESQKSISDKIRNSPEFNKILAPAKLAEKKKNANIEDYLKYINTDLKNTKTDMLIKPANNDHNIFSQKSSLDPSIILPSNFDPAIFKSMMRMYITGIYMSEIKMNEVENIAIIKEKIGKIPKDSPTLHEAIIAIHG